MQEKPTPTRVEIIKSCYPVTSLQVYHGGFRVVRTSLIKSKPNNGGIAKVKEFSKKSAQRLMFVIATTQVSFGSMLTVTFHPKQKPDGKMVKKELNALLMWLKRFFKTKDDEYELEYFWFLEFQKSGNPHFHILLSAMGVTPRARSEFALWWSKRVSEYLQSEVASDRVYLKWVADVVYAHATPETWQVIETEDGAKRYALKYAAKHYQKVAPGWFTDVGRFWGHSSGVSPKPIEEIDITEDQLRKALEDNPVSKWEVLPELIIARGMERFDGIGHSGHGGSFAK